MIFGRQDPEAFGDHAWHDKPIYQGLGSIDFTAACRSVLIVGVDPEDKTLRIIAREEQPRALGSVARLRDHRWPVRVARHIGDCTAEDLCRPPADEDATSARDDAADFLIELLGSDPVAAKQVFAEAKDLEIAERTLKRAKKQLRVTSTRRDNVWFWQLPSKEGQE